MRKYINSITKCDFVIIILLKEGEKNIGGKKMLSKRSVSFLKIFEKNLFKKNLFLIFQVNIPCSS